MRINFRSVNVLNNFKKAIKINSNQTNPFANISFKGNLQKDTLETTSSAKTAKEETFEQQLKEKIKGELELIAINKDKISEKERKISLIREFLNREDYKQAKLEANCKRFDKETVISYNSQLALNRIINAYLKEKEICEKKSSYYQTLKTAYKEDFSKEPDDNGEIAQIKTLQSKIRIYKNNILRSSYIIKETREILDRYLRYFKNEPEIVPCFDKTLREDKISQLLHKNGVIDNKELERIIYEIAGRNGAEVYGAIRNLIKFREKEARELKNIVDMKDSTTKTIIEELKQQKERLTSNKNLALELEIPVNEIIKLELEQYPFSDRNGKKVYVGLIDKNNPKNTEKLAQLSRCYPRASKYFQEGASEEKECLVSALYLQKLGFSDVKTLRTMVQKGQLEGKIEIVESKGQKKYKTLIDVGNYKNYRVLIDLKEQSGNILSFADFAKYLGISKHKLYELIQEGEIDIINEYIYIYEKEKKYIDIKNPKNKEFIDKFFFEKELEAQIKKQNQEQIRKEKEIEKIERKSYQGKIQSLKMKLVWYFCENTRKIASALAVQDGYLCELLIKEDNDEELTQNEKVKINSYRKHYWELTGTEELKEGYKKAEEILQIYSQFGLDAIENKEIKEIIKMYLN